MSVSASRLCVTGGPTVLVSTLPCMERADVNGDGNVDAIDSILQFDVGLLSTIGGVALTVGASGRSPWATRWSLLQTRRLSLRGPPCHPERPDGQAKGLAWPTRYQLAPQGAPLRCEILGRLNVSPATGCRFRWPDCAC